MRKSKEKESEIMKGLSIFEKAMKGLLFPNIDELTFIIRTAVVMSITGHDYFHSGRGIWPFMRAKTMIRSKINTLEYIGWGWKEPNTHIYLEYLAKYFDDLKYIHVIRNGLDMAFSRNQSQLFNWGEIFGISLNSSEPLPKKSLQYWIKANKRAISFGHELLNKRFLIVNFDNLCLNPKGEIALLVDFLEIDIKSIKLHELEKLPKKPKSTGRYRDQDLSIFNKEEIEAVIDLGFDVDY